MIPTILEPIGSILVMVAVWYIGRLSIRGQYLMLAAQGVWIAFATCAGLWWLGLQSVALLGLTLLAIRNWNRNPLALLLNKLKAENGALKAKLDEAEALCAERAFTMEQMEEGNEAYAELVKSLCATAGRICGEEFYDDGPHEHLGAIEEAVSELASLREENQNLRELLGDNCPKVKSEVVR